MMESPPISSTPEASCIRNKRKYRPVSSSSSEAMDTARKPDLEVINCSCSDKQEASISNSRSKGIAPDLLDALDGLEFHGEAELEHLILQHMEGMYRDAVNKIVALGYKSEEAVDAIVKGGFRSLSSIADTAEEYLKCGRKQGAAEECSFSGLEEAQKSVLTEMVRVVREDRPLVSKADALWCLLVADMDISAASSEASACQRSKESSASEVPSIMELRRSSSSNSMSDVASMSLCGGSVTVSESDPEGAEDSFLSADEAYSDNGGEVNVKSYSFSVVEGQDCEANKSFPGELHDDGRHNMHLPKLSQEDSSAGYCLVACTDLSLALTSDADSTAGHTFRPDKADVVQKCTAPEVSAEVLETLERKDRMIKDLNQQVLSLEVQLQERTEWARAKVLQAAQRLSKDFSELRKLRADHEEAMRVEESKSKRFSELESALQKSGTQLEQAKNAIRKLEFANAEIRAEVEAAKLSAAESIARCLEVSRQENKSAKRAQVWEKQRAKLQAEVTAERRKVAEIREQFVQSKEKQHQAEVRSRQESKARDEAVARMEIEKMAREEAEAAAKRREQAMQRKSEADLRRCREEIYKLEQEVRSLRFANDSNQITLISHNEHQKVEKSQLQEAAEWPDFMSVRRDRECVMCLCEEMSVVFLPCAHQVVCTNCNELHEKQGMKDCPSCRTRIQQRIRVYGANR